MDALGYALTVALLALVPQLGPTRAKTYGAMLAYSSAEANVDPWLLLAIGRVETNWNPDNVGDCCGGVMSIRWLAWLRYAESHGLATDRRALAQLATDPARSIRMAANALHALQANCSRYRVVYLGAYQSGVCHANEYGRRVARLASRYRARWSRLERVAVRRRAPPRVLPAVSVALGTAPRPPLEFTAATVAAGP